MRAGTEVVAAALIETAAGRVARIYLVGNPGKLQRLATAKAR